MKKIFLLSMAFAICSTTYAQNFLGMKIKKFGIATTTDQDRVSGLDADYFTGLSKINFRTNLADLEFEDRNITSMTCENPSLRIDLTVLPFRWLPNIQMNLGTSLMLNRRESTQYSWYPDDSNTNDISFSSYSNEAALDASMVFHQKLSFLHFYGGVGSNLGYTFAGTMRVDGNYYDENLTSTQVRNEDAPAPNEELEMIYFDEQHQMKNSLHQRVFLQGGASVILLKRLEFGIEARRGVGYRFNIGNPIKLTDLTSVGFNLRWNLK